MILQRPIGLLGSNCYIVYDREGGLGALVDPGVVEPNSLLQDVDRLSLDIHYILNTHGHFDHIAGNGRLKLPNAQLGIHPADRSLLLNGGGAANFGIPYVASPKPDIELTEGTTLELGDLRINVIHTPGHTPGSVCLHLPGEAALVTGDTLFAGTVGRTDLPGGSARRLTQSLKRLLNLPDETRIYPGHGDPTTLGEERRANPWLRQISDR